MENVQSADGRKGCLVKKVNVEKVAEEIAEKGNGSLIQGNPEDKGVGEYGGKLSEPEKHSQLMELKRKLLERKNAEVDESVVAEIEKRIKKGGLKQISLDRLIDKAIKMRPQRSEQRVEHTGSFAHWILEVKKQEEKYNTIDAD